MPSPVRAAPAAGVATEANDSTLRGLRSRLFKAETDVVALRNQIERFPVFSLQGKLQSGDARAIWVRGTAYAENGNHPFGVLNEESGYLVQAPYPQDLNNGYFKGAYVFVEARAGSNIYGRPPAEYYRLVTSLNARMAQKETLQQAVNARLAGKQAVAAKQAQAKAQAQQERRDEAARVEAVQRAAAEKKRKEEVTARVTQFLAQHPAADAQASTDPDILSRLVDDTLAFEKQVAARDDFPALRDYIVVQKTHLAALQAAKGDLASAVKNAAGAFWSDAPGERSAEGSAEQSDFARQSFGDTATKVYTRQPQLLGQLLNAVAQALPGYMKQAEYGEALKARKFSEVLLRCARGFLFQRKRC
ncbi:MAG: hypothetical protein WKF37_17740 [Bryobacteraceae bacterium]